jgi:hypothetical protein
MMISLVKTKYVELCINSILSSGNHQMKESGKKEETGGFYTAVLKSSECKEKLNVPALCLLRKILTGPT